ncbi:hypothetical protein EYC84_006963 [Monilinia fructicola]|uniref:Uncharacterized protein n=1 Tax=Monilinia fructicola TaxID=38448 RepID=A0A5M9K524_MONFR|nr:hypothetical protein EYC84_006963 [Monilinia fructicola]
MNKINKSVYKISKPSSLFFSLSTFIYNSLQNNLTTKSRYTQNSRSRELLSSFNFPQIIKNFLSQSLKEIFAHFHPTSTLPTYYHFLDFKRSL